jgi:uncharacterized protein YkwD
VSFAPLALAFATSFGPFGIGAWPVTAAHDSAETVPLEVSGSIEVRDDDALAMLAAINAERASRGLGALSLDPRLCEIARSHAEDMAERRYFGHTTPEGLSPFARMDRANYRYSYAGENLALDQSVEAASQALWHSREHRSNILEPHFERVGIAAVALSDGEIFVEDFSD